MEKLFLSEIRHLFKRIKSVLSWIPFLWSNYDWSYGDLLRLIAFKIGRMRKEFESSKYVRHPKKQLRKMKTCEVLLNRIADEGYLYGKVWDDYEAKFGTNTLESLSRPMSPEKKKYFMNMVVYEEAMIKQDLELFLKLFSSQFRRWWD